MSSGNLKLTICCLGCSCGLILEEAAEHLVGEPAPQHAHRLGLAVAGCDAVVDVGASGADPPALRERDAVQGGVDLAVPAAAETEPGGAAPHGERRGPGPARGSGPG